MARSMSHFDYERRRQRTNAVDIHHPYRRSSTETSMRMQAALKTCSALTES
jgi:hypothetical protein